MHAPERKLVFRRRYDSHISRISPLLKVKNMNLVDMFMHPAYADTPHEFGYLSKIGLLQIIYYLQQPL